ncbi:hypothetical protein SESBI_36637 [Sesbania bispinosa]|nr:hypothetical protein SESBI_36637 [Sesbania bispinosa]
MEDYLLKNKGVFPVSVFEAASWDNTFKKDPGDCQQAEVLTFQKIAKNNLQQGQLYLVFFLKKDINRDVSASCLYGPGFGIVSPSL